MRPRLRHSRRGAILPTATTSPELRPERATNSRSLAGPNSSSRVSQTGAILALARADDFPFKELQSSRGNHHVHLSIGNHIGAHRQIGSNGGPGVRVRQRRVLRKQSFRAHPSLELRSFLAGHWKQREGIGGHSLGLSPPCGVPLASSQAVRAAPAEPGPVPDSTAHGEG
jgi:hypothetical protein